MAAANLGRWVLTLDGGDAPPDRELIGGKAWSVARMLALGLNVPPAFVVTTEACRAYLEQGAPPDSLESELDAGIAWLEARTGRRFGSGPKPLLVSVRSGAAVSMPGMMDTVLNLGIDAATEAALAAECGDPAFARDTHRRFREMYARIVLGLDGDDLPPDAPAGVRERLGHAVRAVFASWNTRRARRYRQHHAIPDAMGTAVTVQAMVFGNLDERSGTGVMFSRNPLDGAPAPYGEYLARAQGEDVVSGRHTPAPLESMRATAPEALAQLLEAARALERAHGDVQDIEFTVQHGELFLLQSRSAKRAPRAAIRIAVEMVEEGVIGHGEALRRVSAEQARQVLRPQLEEAAEREAVVLATGEAASEGVGCGLAVRDADAAERLAEDGSAVVLVRETTSPEDVHGMLVARAVVTEAGGSTSHAAVVGRALGLPVVVGCGPGVAAALAGRVITVDGRAGKIYAGALPALVPDERADRHLAQLIDWAAEAAPLIVLTDPGAAPGPFVDLDRLEGGENPERVAELVRGARGARGHVFASDAGVAAAVRAGLEFVVVPQRLPVLLAACAAATP